MKIDTLPAKTQKFLEDITAQLTEKGYPSPEPAVLLDTIVAGLTPEDIAVDIIEFLEANDPDEHPQYRLAGI